MGCLPETLCDQVFLPAACTPKQLTSIFPSLCYIRSSILQCVPYVNIILYVHCVTGGPDHPPDHVVPVLSVPEEDDASPIQQ
jgi:hypothetical protein